MAASAPAKAVGTVIQSAQSLVEADENPLPSAVDTIVNKLTAVCAEHGPGDHQPLSAIAERTYESLAQSVDLRAKERPAPLPTVTVPALHFTDAELSAVRRLWVRSRTANQIAPNL
jgi:hypothetical protein